MKIDSRTVVNSVAKLFASTLCVSLCSCATSPTDRADREPAAVTSPADLLSTGQKLVAAQTTYFDSKMYRTSSFANEQALAPVVQKSGPDYQSAWNILKNEQVEVTIAAHEKLRKFVGPSGIKNTHETGTSGGTSNDVLRDGVEAAYLGMNYEKFQPIPNAVKPKYAYLGPKKGTPSEKLSPPKGIWNYGEDRYVLKLDHVRTRMTLTPGDSLNQMFSFIDANSGKFDREPETINAWNYRFVPWSDRTLLAPILAQAVGKSLKQGSGDTLQQTYGQTLGTRIWYFIDTERNVGDQGGFGGAMGSGCGAQPLAANHGDSSIKIPFALCSSFDKTVKGFENFCPQDCNWSLDYLEAQIWGPVTLDDVAAFVFTQNPPDQAFTDLLKSKGIEIRDERSALTKSQPTNDQANKICRETKHGLCASRTDCLKLGAGQNAYGIDAWMREYPQDPQAVKRMYGNKQLQWSGALGTCTQPDNGIGAAGCCY